jgi:hypothetical protein
MHRLFTYHCMELIESSVDHLAVDTRGWRCRRTGTASVMPFPTSVRMGRVVRELLKSITDNIMRPSLVKKSEIIQSY